jgi:hypothetical protein
MHSFDAGIDTADPRAGTGSQDGGIIANAKSYRAGGGAKSLSQQRD